MIDYVQCVRWFVLASLLMGSSLFMRSMAQAPIVKPCWVRFEFRIDSASKQYSNATEQVQSVISERMATNLATHFPYWEFAPSVAKKYPAFEIGLERTDAQAWILTMQFKPSAAGAKCGEWQVVVLAPGDLDRIVGARFTERLRDEIMRRFPVMLQQDDSINKCLRTYVELDCKFKPPAMQPVATNQTLLVVLPLVWERYQDLADATFRIRCLWRNVQSVSLHSKGTGVCQQYQAQSSFRAIAVEHHEWESDKITDHLADVNDLQPLAVFLEEYGVGPLPCEGATVEMAVGGTQ